MRSEIYHPPLDTDRLPALENLFGGNWPVGGCWCMYWRIGNDYRKRPSATNKAEFCELVKNGSPPGLLAFVMVLLTDVRYCPESSTCTQSSSTKTSPALAPGASVGTFWQDELLNYFFLPPDVFNTTAARIGLSTRFRQLGRLGKVNAAAGFGFQPCESLHKSGLFHHFTIPVDFPGTHPHPPTLMESRSHSFPDSHHSLCADRVGHYPIDMDPVLPHEVTG